MDTDALQFLQVNAHGPVLQTVPKSDEPYRSTQAHKGYFDPEKDESELSERQKWCDELRDTQERYLKTEVGDEW